jgi:hypothetical protein
MNQQIVGMVAIALSIAAPALASSVKYDYDRAVDCSQWKTMAWRVPARPNESMSTERVPTGVLIVEIYDRTTGKLAWRGTVTDELASDPEKADKKTAKAVAKLLQKFPPGGER